MKILYYTSGATGTGRIVRGISIHNALARKNIHCEYSIASSSEFGWLTKSQGIQHIALPRENETILLGNNCRNSALYSTLSELKPDFIVFDLIWYTTYNFIEDFPCKKILLCRQVSDRFFSMEMPDRHLALNPDHFDLILSIEPFSSSIAMSPINPIIMRNRDEILPREKALEALNLSTDKPNCLIACNGEPGEFEEMKKQYSYLKDAGYHTFYSTNYSDKGIFPVVDYFNAFDFVVTGGGYNSFWEMVYFNKECVCMPFPRAFENQLWRVENCQDYYFEENGADKFIDILMNL